MFWNLLLDTTTSTTPPDNGGSKWGSYIMIGVIVLALVGMFVWQTISGKKKQKQAQEMLNGIKIGDRVKTIGGICGFVAEIRESDNTFVLETGMDGKTCFIRFDKGAVYQTSPEGVVRATESVVKEEKPAETAVVESAPVEVEAPKKAKKAKKAKAEPVEVVEPAVETTEEVKEEITEENK